MYILVINNELIQCGTFCFDERCKEVSIDYDEYIYNQDKYIFVDGDFIIDPDYDEKQKEKEKERISHLKMTKRVCALMLQELGVPYSQLKAEIAKSEDAQLEWDLCVELERSNPLINIIGATFGLSPEQIDQMFKYANGEVDSLEVANE